MTSGLINRKVPLALVILLMLVVSVGLLSVVRFCRPTDVTTVTPVGFATRISQYDVASVLAGVSAIGGKKTIDIVISSSKGPIYVEEIQLFFSNPQNNTVYLSYLLEGIGVNSSAGVGLAGVVLRSGSTYSELVSAISSVSSLVTGDSLGNAAIASPAFLDVQMRSSQFAGPRLTVIALCVVPSGASVALVVTAR